MLNREHPQPEPRRCGSAYIHELNGRVRLRHYSALRGVVDGLACLVAVATMFLFAFACPSKYASAGPPPVRWSWVGVALLVTAGVLLVRRLIDDRIVVDVASGRLDFERRILWFRWKLPVESSGKLLAVAVNASSRASQYNTVIWKYGLSFLCRDGRLIEALSPSLQDREAVEQEGKELAQRLQLLWYAGEARMFPKVEQSGFGPKVFYGTDDTSGNDGTFCLGCMVNSAMMLAVVWVLGWVVLQFLRV